MPSLLHHELVTKSPDCNNTNGSISISEEGGVAPYQFSWSHSPHVGSYADKLRSGSYSITVTDNNKCTEQIEITLVQIASTLSHSVNTIQPDCKIANGEIDVTESDGSPPYDYQWTPQVSKSEKAVQLSEGHYTVIVTDAGGCRDSLSLYLHDNRMFFSLGSDTTLCKGQSIVLQPTMGFANYHWDDGSTLPERIVSAEGNYILTVTNEGGCSASDTIRLFSSCGDIHYPSAFSPDHNFNNDLFGPIGSLSLIKSYRLLIYNRFGNLIFQSVNPYSRWNGRYKNQQVSAGTYVYIATYEYDGEKQIQK